MKILLASTSSGSRGGGELALLYLGRALVARGHEVTLWASTHPRMDELTTQFAEFGSVRRSPYVNTYDRRGRSLSCYFDKATALRVGEEWKALAPDIVHLNKQNLEDGLDLLAAARLFFFLMLRRPPRSTLDRSPAASISRGRSRRAPWRRSWSLR